MRSLVERIGALVLFVLLAEAVTAAALQTDHIGAPPSRAEIARAVPRLLPRFTRVFTSHEIGHRKPQAAAFEHVLREIGVPAGEVLLFDDLVPNIESAKALGMQAVVVRGPEDVREGLVASRVISP